MPIALRYAWRELRRGPFHFAILIACLALGVAAIAAVQSLTRGVEAELARDSSAILGGDIVLRLLYREAPPEAVAALRRLGTVSEGVELRGTARPAGSDAAGTLVEVKAVDDGYPLYGTLTLEGGGDPRQALAEGALVEPAALDRLGVPVGGEIALGTARLRIAGVIAREPDRLGGGFALGPRLILDRARLAATGLEQPGSLVTYVYRLRLPPGASLDAAKTALPRDIGWSVRDRGEASPQLAQWVERLGEFLTLVGLTALLVGGVGVGNAVSAYLDAKAPVIATLKGVGASSATLAAMYLAEIMALAALATAIGLALGAATPALAVPLLAKLLPVPVAVGLYPEGLALAALYGLLTALAFTLWPLGRALSVPAASLFRDRVAPATVAPPLAYQAAALGTAALLAAVAVLTAERRLLALGFVGGAIASVLIFAGVARGAKALARRIRPRGATLRLGLANVGRPGAPTGSIVLSLGLGLTVLVAVALVRDGFDRLVGETLPARVPAFFFVDIQPAQREPLQRQLQSIPGVGVFAATPMLRGRILAADGVPAEQAIKDPEFAWVLQSDRGITHSATLPSNAKIVQGAWWPPDYAGPPLVSVAVEVARLFGIGPGHKITVDILGRPMEATIGSVRALDWGTLGINFTIVFAPGAIDAAPQTDLATLEAEPAAEPAVQRLIAQTFPNVTAIRVKDALEQANGVVRDIAGAVTAIATVTLAAGALVLAGAVAAGHRRRVYDAVVLKVLGATRATVARAALVEFGAIGLVTALAAAALGTLAAWGVLTQVMRIGFAPSPLTLLLTAGLGAAATLAAGFVGIWAALGRKPAPYLRVE